MDATNITAANSEKYAAEASAFLELLPDNVLRLLVEGLKHMLEPDYKPVWPQHGICSNLGNYLSGLNVHRHNAYNAVVSLSTGWEHFNGDCINPVPTDLRELLRADWRRFKWEGQQRALRVGLMQHMLGLLRGEQERRLKGTRKWEKPGAYKITSYRSFRRYKAAGARFEDRTGNAQAYFFYELDIDTARRRAQAPDITGVTCLWAVVE